MWALFWIINIIATFAKLSDQSMITDVIAHDAWPVDVADSILLYHRVESFLLILSVS